MRGSQRRWRTFEYRPKEMKIWNFFWFWAKLRSRCLHRGNRGLGNNRGEEERGRRAVVGGDRDRGNRRRDRGRGNGGRD